MTFRLSRDVSTDAADTASETPREMTPDEIAQGAEPVGQVSDTTRGEQRLLHCVRLWMNGPDYQEAIWNTLAVGLGTAKARHVLRAFEAYMTNIAVSINCKLYRHAPACPCLGRHEAVLLTIVRHAAVGDAFSAAVHAASLVRDDRVSSVVDAAAELGSHVAAEVAEAARTPTTSPPAGAILH